MKSAAVPGRRTRPAGPRADRGRPRRARHEPRAAMVATEVKWRTPDGNAARGAECGRKVRSRVAAQALPRSAPRTRKAPGVRRRAWARQAWAKGIRADAAERNASAPPRPSPTRARGSRELGTGPTAAVMDSGLSLGRARESVPNENDSCASSVVQNRRLSNRTMWIFPFCRQGVRRFPLHVTTTPGRPGRWRELWSDGKPRRGALETTYRFARTRAARVVARSPDHRYLHKFAVSWCPSPRTAFASAPAVG